VIPLSSSSIVMDCIDKLHDKFKVKLFQAIKDAARNYEGSIKASIKASIQYEEWNLD